MLAVLSEVLPHLSHLSTCNCAEGLEVITSFFCATASSESAPTLIATVSIEQV